MEDQKHSEEEEAAASAIAALRECPAGQPVKKRFQSSRIARKQPGDSFLPENPVSAEGPHPLHTYMDATTVSSQVPGRKKSCSMKRPASTDNQKVRPNLHDESYSKKCSSSPSGPTRRCEMSSIGSSSTSASPQSPGINDDNDKRHRESSSMSEEGYAGGKSLSASCSGSDDGVSNRNQRPRGTKKNKFDVYSGDTSPNSSSSDSESENLASIDLLKSQRVKAVQYVDQSAKNYINSERVEFTRRLKPSTSSKEAATWEERVESGTKDATEATCKTDHCSQPVTSHERIENEEAYEGDAKNTSRIRKKCFRVKRGWGKSDTVRAKRKVCYDQEEGELRPAPYFYYVDRSREEDDDPLTPFTPPARVPIFPAKMHALLMRDDLKDIVRWMPHGRSFKVLNQREFELRIIPTYFEHGKFSSFVRQAQGWGFRRLTKGQEHHAFYNEYFLRGLPHLCKKMTRPSMTKKINTNPDHEPYLFDISIEHPVPQKVPPDNMNYTILDAVGRCILNEGPKARLPVVLCMHDNIMPKSVSRAIALTADSKPNTHSASKETKIQAFVNSISTTSNEHSSTPTNFLTNPSKFIAAVHHDDCKSGNLRDNTHHQPAVPSSSPQNSFPNQFIRQILALQQQQQQIQFNHTDRNQTPEILFRSLTCPQPLQNRSQQQLQSNQLIQQALHQNHNFHSPIIEGNSSVPIFHQEGSRSVPNMLSNLVSDAFLQQQLQQQQQQPGLNTAPLGGAHLLSHENLAGILENLATAQSRNENLGLSERSNSLFEQNSIPHALAEQPNDHSANQQNFPSNDSFPTLQLQSHDTLHNIILEAVRIGAQLGAETAARLSNSSGYRSPDYGNGDFDPQGSSSHREN